jgi:UDP-N-acetylglucosamine 4,6-dehydratase
LQDWINLMKHFKDSSILITGATGSIGRQLVSQLLKETSARRIAIFSRDELKQSKMREDFENDDRLRWFLGDIRDLERLKQAMYNVDFVIHTAALKQVDTGEYNPIEFIKTNILGSQNVVEASIYCKVKKVIALSTDKASSPINLYGATKLTADKLFISANNYGHPRGTSFSVVRYGNVMGSRGSVIPFFKELSAKGQRMPVTDLRMTRFWITIEHASQFILESFVLMNGGELYVPKIPSMKIVDLAKAIGQNAEIFEIGVRPGEKLHEEMISEDDSKRTYILGDRYVVTPVSAEWGFVTPLNVQFMEEGTAYRSNTNKDWLTEGQIKEFILRSDK